MDETLRPPTAVTKIDFVQQRAEALIEEFGGVRAAGRQLGITPALLSRLRKGGVHPSDKTLEILGLERVYRYKERKR